MEEKDLLPKRYYDLLNENGILTKRKQMIAEDFFINESISAKEARANYSAIVSQQQDNREMMKRIKQEMKTYRSYYERN